jgi:hypothetical protein
MKPGMYAGIARIWTGDKQHAGMGIVIDSRRVLTCAHVVNVAVGLRALDRKKPQSKVSVGFALFEHIEPIAGRVIHWSPAQERDVAVIELDSDVPAQVSTAVFAGVDAPLDGDLLRVYGIGQGQKSGRHIEAKFMGETREIEAQIDGIANAQLFAMPGYSGAGVWDTEHDGLIGMLCSGDRDGKRVAFITPVEVLERECAYLPVERRQLLPSFNRRWPVGALLFFLGMLYFFGANLWWRDYPPQHPQLAAFAGAHFYAIFGCVMGWFLRAHARDFHLHPWPLRLPGVRSLQFKSGLSGQKLIASLLIVFIVLAPLYGQGRFLKVVNVEGHVFVYPRDFGFEPGTRGPCLTKDLSSNQVLCRHEDAGIYSLVTPGNDAPGGYFKNRYHYGDVRGDDGGKSVNFYPIAQPVMLILLSIWAAVLNFQALFLVFRKQRPRTPAPGLAIGTPQPAISRQ